MINAAENIPSQSDFNSFIGDKLWLMNEFNGHNYFTL